MIDDYSRETGHKFNFTIGPTGLLRDTIASGKPADLIIASAPLMARARSRPARSRRAAASISAASAGRRGRAGAPAPDISTPEAVKQALLKATSIAYTDPKLGGDLGRRI